MFFKSKESGEPADHGPKTNNAFEDSKPEESHVERIRQSQAHYEIDPVLSKRLDRKFDVHIIPWLFGIWYDFRLDRNQYRDTSARN